MNNLATDNTAVCPCGLMGFLEDVVQQVQIACEHTTYKHKR